MLRAAQAAQARRRREHRGPWWRAAEYVHVQERLGRGGYGFVLRLRGAAQWQIFRLFDFFSWRDFTPDASFAIGRNLAVRAQQPLHQSTAVSTTHTCDTTTTASRRLPTTASRRLPSTIFRRSDPRLKLRSVISA
eukprot:scaffold7319_cov72-Phaeocystis_antarctica.AAC.1